MLNGYFFNHLMYSIINFNKIQCFPLAPARRSLSKYRNDDFPPSHKNLLWGGLNVFFPFGNTRDLNRDVRFTCGIQCFP